MPRQPFHPNRLGAAALCIAGVGAVFASGSIAVAATPAAATAATPAATSTDAPAKASGLSQAPRGKGNNSGVVLSPQVPEKIALGETVTLRLAFSGVSAAEGAMVEVRDPAARTTLLTARLAKGEQKTLELPYTGRNDGMQFIDVVTTQGGRSTVQSVPLRVGTGELRLKPEGNKRTTATGEAVISLPAASPK